MALNRVPEPAMLFHSQLVAQPAAPRANPRAAALVACAMAAFACALPSTLHAGELPPEQPADTTSDQDADLSPSIAPLSWQTILLDNVLAASDVAPNQTFLPDWTVAATADISAPNAAQIRIHFAEWLLPGDEGVDGAMLRITSLSDGATQTLGAAQMRAWSGAPAYFNGGAVRVELLVRGSRELWAAAFLRGAYAEALNAYAPRSICGSVDDRVPDTDPIVARVWPIGCSATIIDDANSSLLTAGHCGPASGSVVQFNVPLSSASGVPISPPPADQFPVDFASVQRQSEGTGQDWSYFGAFSNTTGQTPAQQQGQGAVVAAAAPTQADTPLRIAGFGTTSLPISPTWNQAQKTHDGPLYSIVGTRLRHRVDTTGGNSGSGIMLNAGPTGASRVVVGIHTHAGCSTTTTSSNVGTVIEHPNLQAAFNLPRGVCASGTAEVELSEAGQMWIGQDAANNVGVIQVNQPAGAFASRLKLPGTIQAMATDAAGNRIIAITHQLAVYAIDPATAEASLLGTLTSSTGASVPMITGLAITSGPGAGEWYAVAQATSELFQIDPGSLQAQRITSLGAAGVLRIGALDADSDPRYLLALDDNAVVGTRLVEIDLAPASPTYRLVGTLGIGAVDCNALARTGDGRWITADVATGRLLEVGRGTGAATFLANIQGTFIAGMGLAWVDAAGCIADFDDDGGVSGNDIGAFFTMFEAGDPAADVNGSGGIDAADIATFFAAFEAGC